MRSPSLVAAWAIASLAVVGCFATAPRARFDSPRGCQASAKLQVPERVFPARALCGDLSTELARACCAKDELDTDHDGVPDSCEQLLAERFAPIVHHASDEPNFPTNVDAFLQNTTLGFFDDACAPDLLIDLVTAPTQAELLTRRVEGSCGTPDVTDSSGTRSRAKQRTFFLADVPRAFRSGSGDTREWTTYFHAHPNELGGVTLQYWRFYAYNEAMIGHGGDWEGVHVSLGRELEPSDVRLLGHTGMRRLSWSDLEVEGTHPHVFSEPGGHSSQESSANIVAPGSAFVRQETWSSGRVHWPSGRVTTAGRLLNVGEKTASMNGQVFLQYSGLWGSPGLLFVSSGYWGPAYNETSMDDDGFARAWCAGMTSRDLASECCPAGESR